MTDWRDKLNANRRPVSMRHTDLNARSIDVADDVSRTRYEDPANPLRGIWGREPNAWLDEIRGEWSAPKPPPRRARRGGASES